MSLLHTITRQITKRMLLGIVRMAFHRRMLAILISLVATVIFIQHEFIVQTSFLPAAPMRQETTKTPVGSIDRKKSSGQNRKTVTQQQKQNQIQLNGERRTLSYPQRRTTTTTTTTSPTQEDNSSNASFVSSSSSWWAPPRLHTCSISINETVTFAIPSRHIIIAGAQKSGTSALYFFLSQHPYLLPAISLESHYFDWQYPSSPRKIRQWMQQKQDYSQQQQQQPVVPFVRIYQFFRCTVLYEYFTQYYDADQLWDAYLTNRSLVTFEKTPSYLFLDRVPQRIYDAFPRELMDVKIVISLRHPIERAYSQFHSDRMFDQVPLNATFESYLNMELTMMRRFKLTNAPNLPVSRRDRGVSITADRQLFNTLTPIQHWNRSMFAIPKRVLKLTKAYLSSSSSTTNASSLSTKNNQNWLDQAHWNVYRNLFKNNYLQRSMYAVQLRRWMKYFALHDQLLVVPYELFLDHPQDVVDDILHFSQVAMPYYFHTHLYSKNATAEFKSVYYHHGGQKEPLAIETRQYMERFLEPYNQDLAQLLLTEGQKYNNTSGKSTPRYQQHRIDWMTIWKQVPPTKVIAPAENHMLFSPEYIANHLKNNAKHFPPRHQWLDGFKNQGGRK